MPAASYEWNRQEVYPQAGIQAARNRTTRVSGETYTLQLLPKKELEHATTLLSAAFDKQFRQCQISMTFCQHCDVCFCDAQSLDVLEVEGDPLKNAVHVKLLAAPQAEVLDVQLPEA